MSLQITKMFVPQSKYNIKCPYSMVPEYVTIHNTYNDASAMSEISYMISNNNQVSYHYAVDDIRAVQGIPEDQNTWNAGDGGSGKGNRKSIAIEICYSKSGGDRFTKAEQNAAYLAAAILKQRGWDISHLRKHQDWSGKYCPHRTLDMGWERFVSMVQSYLTGASQVVQNQVTITGNELYRVRKSWSDTSSQIGAYTNLDNAKAACIQGYSIYNKSGNVVYQNPIPAPVPVKKEFIPVITYQVYANGQWYAPVTNLSDYAGDGRNPIRAVMIKTDVGSIKYRVHVKAAGRWYGYVTGYNPGDPNNGYAGDGRNDIDAIEVYYTTPDGYIYRVAKYRVAVKGVDYYSWQRDNETSNGQDGYAGCLGKPIVKLQVTTETA